MSKSTENVLLAPGESGWEIWTSTAGSPYTLYAATTAELASELSDLPAGDLTLLFPVKAVTAVPMRVSSDDEALFPDLAALHAERLGLRPDPLAGQLTDVFLIHREAENSSLVSILLRAPGEGEMPPRGPKAFDISPRAFPLPGDALAVWKEFGRWVFSLSHQGKLVYCQATSVTASSPDENLAREIRLALIQLSMQGLEIEPNQIAVWTGAEKIGAAALSLAFRAPVQISPRPAPILPEPLSKLLPADVRAARRAARKRRHIMMGIAAVGLLYLGVIGWYGYGLWKDLSETRTLVQKAKELAPEAEHYKTHIAKWDELADVIQLRNSPVEILSKVASSIPPNSGLRLKSAEVSSAEIKLQGEAQTFEPPNTFSLNLSKNRDLEQFTWETPPANQSTRGWEFSYSASTVHPTP